MKMRNLWLALLAAFGLACGQLKAQDMMWAKDVRNVSSAFNWDKNPYAYQAFEAVGRPSTLPGPDRFSTSAWAPSKAGAGEEFIELGYGEGLTGARQVAIVQNTNPGAVVKVIILGPEGQEKVVANQPAGIPNPDDNLPLIVRFDPTDYPVVGVRVVLNTTLKDGYNQIDAVGISKLEAPIEVRINLVEGYEQEVNRQRLPMTVNSAAFELSPVISPDGKRLYYTRQDHHRNFGYSEGESPQDIWFSEINGDEYVEAVNVGGPLNNDDNNSALSITPDGQRMLIMNVYDSINGNKAGISITQKQGAQWGWPEEVIIDNFYNDNRYGEYKLASDGRTLIMAIERKDGRGSKDVHVSFRKPDGTFTAPKNLGPTINTVDSEIGPYLADDGVTLYFASYGHPGYGSSDVFVSRRLDDTWTNWSIPQNLGPNINTPDFDAYYAIPASGKYAYFVSSGQADGDQDIWRVDLPPSARPKPVLLVKGHVLNAKTKEPIGADILYESLSLGKELGIALSNSEDGFYSIILPSGDEYGFLAQAKGFASVNENLDLRDADEYGEIEQDLFLVPLETGQVIRLNNVFFDVDKFDLRKESHLELNRLASMLKTNPSLRIEVGGHTDNQGDDAYNQRLSLNRAKAVHSYLVSQGVDAKRLVYKGYGEAKPEASNDSPEGRQLNRRVEFIILEN